MAGRRRSDRALRGKLRSPGRPPVARQEHRRRFWAFIAAGLSSEDAAMEVGVSQPVGFRWFRTPGGWRRRTCCARPSRFRNGLFRLLGGRRSRCCGRRAWACGRLHAGWGGRRARCRASCVATRPRGVASWRIGPSRRNGTRSGRHIGQSGRSWPSTRHCGRMCRTACPAPWPSRRGRNAWTGRALERPSTWASAGPALGAGVEPAADCPAPAARLPG